MNNLGLLSMNNQESLHMNKIEEIIDIYAFIAYSIGATWKV
jgi:hypothetical protein